MNKSELIDAMAADAGISKAAAKTALESLIGSVESTLKGGGRGYLFWFVYLSISKRPPTSGWNTQTRGSLKKSAKKGIKFKTGADLSSSVN